MAETPGGGGPPAAPQRRWQAPCPNCGAPVAFQSAASPVAICGFCRSTVVRDGESLRKIGESAELFDDHSELQLGVSGKLEARGFTLIGRLQLGYSEAFGKPAEAPLGADLPGALSSAGGGQAAGGNARATGGSWNQWHALFDDGASGWLSEDNDQYVFAFDQPLTQPPPTPTPEDCVPGARVAVGGKPWRVASRVHASVRAAQGELPKPPPTGRAFAVVDLRNPLGEIGTLDYSDAAAPQFSIGKAVRLQALSLRGLRDGFDHDAATVKGRSFDCPNCGAPVEAKLAETKSLTCGTCKSLIDLGAGVGADLTTVKQAQVYEPRIPLGKTGRLQVGPGEPQDWQVVGFSVREGSEDGESFRWYDYLLYNRTEGFAFLADTSEGWVGFRTLTGVPENLQGDNDRVIVWEGARYAKAEQYSATVLFVEGEFYWTVVRDQQQWIADYAGLGSGGKLSREGTDDEIVWSAGLPVAAAAVSEAFGLQALPEAMSSVGPASGAKLGSWVVWLIIIIVILFMLSECMSCGGGGYAGSTGGSYGGYSSGGGHK